MSKPKKKYDRRTVLQLKWNISGKLFNRLTKTDVNKSVSWIEGYKAASDEVNKVVDRMMRHSE